MRKLKLLSAAKRAKDKLAAWLEHMESYPVRRRIFNAHRGHQHPAMMTPSRRRKLRGN